ncbi:hypothetical protein [Lysinibacillus piscis]|uniref:Lipoprotein n=1 Tax=Lysinibacillus piscis TaxID=2518931 RepID=A0ABQ5NM65_9BACI|nr:hypothetical protein [Lysinibacillus sp. KH24]GLC89119.1 hypothetical protein LYSBPC_22460 [Lysinibacillus sp. KH24]
MKKILIYQLVMLFILVGCSSAVKTNPTARSILADNPQADILQYKDVVYRNVTEEEWLDSSTYIKGEKLGEIAKRTTSTLFFKNCYATKLKAGTSFFATNNNSFSMIIVEIGDKQLLYQALLEG